MNVTIESPDSSIELADQHLKKGEPLVAYNIVQEALARWPANRRLTQLQALALARSGDIERANEMLQGLANQGVDDSETLGLLARTHKDLALGSPSPTSRARHLDASYELYARAYENARRDNSADAAWYTGINAATLAVLRRQVDTARRIAREVNALCAGLDGTDEQPGARYWREATLGEASLILGDLPAARGRYAEAMALAGRRYGDVSSTRKQARLLAHHLELDFDVTEMLRVPPVLVFSGHMIDRADRAVARFPASLEPAVRAAVRARLATTAPFAVYGSAACGADLICLEAAREAGCETHIVLPFPPQDFRVASVDFAGDGWGERFETALAMADSVTVTSDHYARGSMATFDYANLVLTGMGRLRSQALDAGFRALVVRHPVDRATQGGTTSQYGLWRDAGLEIDEVLLTELQPEMAQLPAGDVVAPQTAPASIVRHEMRAMLFADAVGYSKLSEDQIPGYIEGFLGAVGELGRRSGHPYEHVETSGDGLYMVFRSAADAGHFALELSAATNAFDRAKWGLPLTFNLRVALHCGPVHCATDPITGGPIYTGPHTSRAARIEPITPPGQVYASSAFAAVAAATGAQFAMSYVGRMPLAKGYGSLGLYHLRSNVK